MAPAILQKNLGLVCSDANGRKATKNTPEHFRNSALFLVKTLPPTLPCDPLRTLHNFTGVNLKIHMFFYEKIYCM